MTQSTMAVENETADHQSVERRCARSEVLYELHRTRLTDRLVEVGLQGDAAGLADFLLNDEVVRESVASTLPLGAESRVVDGVREVRLVSDWSPSMDWLRH